MIAAACALLASCLQHASLQHASGCTSPSHRRPGPAFAHASSPRAGWPSLVAIIPVAAIAVGIGPIPAEIGSWARGHGTHGRDGDERAEGHPGNDGAVVGSAHPGPSKPIGPAIPAMRTSPGTTPPRSAAPARIELDWLKRWIRVGHPCVREGSALAAPAGEQNQSHHTGREGMSLHQAPPSDFGNMSCRRHRNDQQPGLPSAPLSRRLGPAVALFPSVCDGFLWLDRFLR